MTLVAHPGAGKGGILTLPAGNPMTKVVVGFLAFEVIVFGLAIPGMILVSGVSVVMSIILGCVGMVVSIVSPLVCHARGGTCCPGLSKSLAFCSDWPPR